MDEHVPKVPDAPRFHDGLFDHLLFLRDQSGTGTIKDVADMCAVFVVSAAEQGGVFVEEHGLDGSKVARQAVDGLAHVIVFQMQDFPGPELVELPVRKQQAVAFGVAHPAHVDGGQVACPDDLAQPVSGKLEVGVRKNHVVRADGVHVPAGQGGGRSKPPHRHVDLELKDRAVVGVRLEQPRQSGQGDGG